MTQSGPPAAGGLCRSLAEAAVHARRPFMPDLVQAKIHSIDRDGRFADIAYYIDARAVMDRLNVLLPGRWHAAYELVERRPGGEDDEPVLVYRCHLTVAEATYTDVGEGADHKAAQSDALKRAAVHVGIGHCVYRIAGPRMFAGPGPDQLRRSRRGRFYLDDANHAWLRDRYRAWLIDEGVAEYGLPLHHGAAARAIAPELFPPRFARRRTNGTTPRSEAATPDAARATASAPGANGDGSNGSVRSTNGAGATGSPRQAASNGAAQSPGAAADEVPAERLGPVAKRGAETPPAPPEQRAMLLDAAAKRGYRRETVLGLAEVVGATMFDRLDARGLRDLLAFLDSAANGHATDADLAAKLDELGGSDGRESARERLAVWLLDREETAAAAP